MPTVTFSYVLTGAFCMFQKKNAVLISHNAKHRHVTICKGNSWSLQMDILQFLSQYLTTAMIWALAQQSCPTFWSENVLAGCVNFLPSLMHQLFMDVNCPPKANKINLCEHFQGTDRTRQLAETSLRN